MEELFKYASGAEATRGSNLDGLVLFGAQPVTTSNVSNQSSTHAMVKTLGCIKSMYSGTARCIVGLNQLTWLDDVHLQIFLYPL